MNDTENNTGENSNVGETPVAIYSAAHEAEAAIVANALSNAGIESTTHGDFSAGFRAEAPGEVRILIHKNDVAAAKAVLEDIKTDEEIDWDNVDVGEPEG